MTAAYRERSAIEDLEVGSLLCFQCDLIRWRDGEAFDVNCGTRRLGNG